MYQPYPSSGQPAGPLRPAAPAPVLTAVKLMYAGAAASTAGLVIGLALIIVDIKAAARGRFLGHSLAAPQIRPLIITVWIVFGLVVIAMWLWMARADGQGRSWARILSAVLFGLATLQLRGDFTQPVSHAGFGVTVLYTAAPCCSPRPGWPAALRCGCSGARPPRVLQAAGLHADRAASWVSGVACSSSVAGTSLTSPGPFASHANQVVANWPLGAHTRFL